MKIHRPLYIDLLSEIYKDAQFVIVEEQQKMGEREWEKERHRFILIIKQRDHRWLILGLYFYCFNSILTVSAFLKKK